MNQRRGMNWRVAALVIASAGLGVLGAEGCGGSDAATTTPDASAAVDASATCAAGTTMCGSQCVATAFDPGNCGTCGTKCAADQVCSAGACALTCVGGTTKCGASCLDTNADPKNCGGCGAACTSGQVCSSGKCATSCAAGLVQCGTSCVDPKSNPSFCGASAGCGVADAGSAGTACVSGQVCSAGTCALSCQAGLFNCGGTCIDPNSNPKFCGATAGCGADAGSAGVVCNGSQACSAGACAPLANPVPNGIAALYDARVTASVIKDNSNNVSQWNDLSGNSRNLTSNGGTPVYNATLVNSLPGLDFGGGKGMISAAYPLTTEVTLFAVIQWGVPGAWGSIAHHGNRDNDWAMEQNALKGINVTHWQSSNDNSGVELTLVPSTNYILTGRIAGTTRYYSATSSSTVSATGTGVSLTAGSKIMYVGKSDVNEASNAKYGELLYYSRALSDGERDQVIAYLKASWGL